MAAEDIDWGAVDEELSTVAPGMFHTSVGKFDCQEYHSPFLVTSCVFFMLCVMFGIALCDRVQIPQMKTEKTKIVDRMNKLMLIPVLGHTSKWPKNVIFVSSYLGGGHVVQIVRHRTVVPV